MTPPLLDCRPDFAFKSFFLGGGYYCDVYITNNIIAFTSVIIIIIFTIATSFAEVLPYTLGPGFDSSWSHPASVRVRSVVPVSTARAAWARWATKRTATEDGADDGAEDAAN